MRTDDAGSGAEPQSIANDESPGRVELVPLGWLMLTIYGAFGSSVGRCPGIRRARTSSAELRTALTRAGADLELAGPQAVLARWHALATMAANPLTDDEQAQVARAKAGDFSGFSVRDEHGNWTTL